MDVLISANVQGYDLEFEERKLLIIGGVTHR